MLRLPLFLFLLITLPARAQWTEGQPPRWIFGNRAGLDFSAGAPQAFEGAAMNTVEGAAVACDAAGQVLFYTDGHNVWDRQHQRMPNGRGLDGSPNSCQAALVVRQPGADSLWYIFTTDFQGSDNGLRYSTISMARRGGLGDIIQKDQLLVTPVTEKLTAVRHANGRDVWVLAHRFQSAVYLAYLVTPDGVQLTPVSSTAGSMHAGAGRNAIGYLRAAPDGRHLAAALWKDASKFEVLDFDPANGEVNGRVTLEPYAEAYGVEFSADGSKLYGTANGADGETGAIWQFDLRPGPGSNGAQYNVVVGRSHSRKVGALLRGPDGRIYVARDGAKFLGVIQQPNQPGQACQYVDDGVPLGNGRSRLGLPNNW